MRLRRRVSHEDMVFRDAAHLLWPLMGGADDPAELVKTRALDLKDPLVLKDYLRAALVSELSDIRPDDLRVGLAALRTLERSPDLLARGTFNRYLFPFAVPQNDPQSFFRTVADLIEDWRPAARRATSTEGTAERYSLFGSEGELADVARACGEALQTEVLLHDSSYVGEYFRIKGPSDSTITITSNRPDDEGNVLESAFAEWPVIVHESCATSPVSPLAGVEGLVLLREEWL